MSPHSVLRSVAALRNFWERHEQTECFNNSTSSAHAETGHFRIGNSSGLDSAELQKLMKSQINFEKTVM